MPLRVGRDARLGDRPWRPRKARPGRARTYRRGPASARHVVCGPCLSGGVRDEELAMKRTGYFVMLVGVAVAAFGMAQLGWVAYTSPGPNPNPVGNGMLMAGCWSLGIILFGAGGWL